ncbi:hypothetical protein R6Q57_020752 [Mikania cordata]
MKKVTFRLVWPRRAVLASTACLGHSNEEGDLSPGMAKTGRLDQYGPSWTDGLVLPCLYFITEMDAEMPHQEDVAQQGPPLDPETLALSQHEWLQFEPQSAAAKCRQIIRMSMRTPHCIDWGVLADFGEAVHARIILGEDTSWTRLFELAELPTYRLITVEFLSTFRYRAHHAAVRAEDDAELPPDIEFSLGGQHFEMSIERFAVHLGIYYEPETVLDDFAQG